VKGAVPVTATDAIEHLMPTKDIPYRLAHRVAGLGSLGHARYVAIADWNGGRIAREAKALVSSACYWAMCINNNNNDQEGQSEILYQAIITRAVRCLDPFVQLRGHWIVRRLSPHCSRIELSALRAPGKELRLLRAMGWETANIHLATKTARKLILRHIQKQKSRWLHVATAEMLKSVRDDWKTWTKDGYA
jgi:hypothetical protein